MSNDSILTARSLSKEYRTGEHTVAVLSNISLELAPGESVALVGPSGSGKTTLLSMCAGLERPSGGSITVCGKQLETLSEDDLAGFRSTCVGFVFQSFQLVPTLTARENVMLPLELRGENGAAKRAADLLDRVGLADRRGHYPAQLSGGEQQRVAIARAYINHPAILFADEPTGNLDLENAGLVEELLFELQQSLGTALLIATHNEHLARRAGRLLRLAGGRLDQAQVTR